MGQSESKTIQKKQMLEDSSTPVDGPVIECDLKKYRPGCTGMFWRSDPTRRTKLASNDNWPRDGARLRGIEVSVKGEAWLLATEVKQAGSNTWVKAPTGAALPFEYNQHYYLAKVQG